MRVSNTAEALESMTDRGKFERLTAAVIRKANKDYASILSLSPNAKGEPIKSSLDGFCLVPGSVPPRFLLTEYTTTDRKGLERKWLYDCSITPTAKPVSSRSDGDLVKACRETLRLREKFPDAEFTVILATNQRLSEDLAVKVYEKTTEFKVACDIWDQSRLVEFLDSTADGQWFRKEYLGIETETLSESLLRDLCKQSLARYEKELLLADARNWVLRDVDGCIEELSFRNYTVLFLVGESGLGKSTAAFKRLQNHLAAGGYGLWAPTELIKGCPSLDCAIGDALRSLHLYLPPDVGKNVFQFVRGNSRFLFVVDDVSRTDAPSNLIQKLLAWSKPAQSGEPDLKQSLSSCLIVCPVWPQIWERAGNDFSKASWIQTITIGPMSSQEGSVAARTVTSLAGVEITNAEADALAKKLGNDPILISLFGSLLTDKKPSDINVLAEGVFEKFITSAITQAAASKDNSCLPVECREALSKLSFLMLRKRKLHPSWKDIRGWLEKDPNALDALRVLIRDGKLCRLTNQDHFVFRHDRIQEFLLVEAMTTVLDDHIDSNEILFEPFYAEIIGRALAAAPQRREILKEIRDRLPLALVEAVRVFGVPTSRYHGSIIEEIKEWTAITLATHSMPDSVLNAVCWCLLGTDSPAVLEITELLPYGWFVDLARLRNGSAKSGAKFFSSYADFGPAINYPLRDQVIEHAKSRHRESLIRDLKQLLVSSAATDKDRRGALCLAGFLGFSDLQDEVAVCWEFVQDQDAVLSEAIWAAIHCCSEPDRLLGPLIMYWAGMSDEAEPHGISPRQRIAEDLRFALARGIRKDVLKYLIGQCEVHGSLHGRITYMLEAVDEPDALEHGVRFTADIARRIRGTGQFSPWLSMWLHNWDSSHGSRRRLSRRSMLRLKSLYEDDRNDDFVKKQAFQLWLAAVKDEHIETLKAIQSGSPLFSLALQKRVQLGDQSVVPGLVQLLESEPHRFRIAHHVWCDAIMAVAEKHLDTFRDNIPTDFSGGHKDVHDYLSRLLMMIPVKDAEKLLERYWEHLGYSPLFIQSALYVGTPRSLELAASSISRCPTTVPLFEHVHFHFGFMESERQKYLTAQHLENLLPYLDRLGEHELWECAEACQRLGIPEWGERHLSHRLSEVHRRRYYPSEDDLLQDLDEFAAQPHGVWRVRHWLEESDKRHKPRNHALSIVDRWLASQPTIRALEIAAECVQAIGTRNDLSMLDKYAVEGSLDKIASIKASAHFSVCRRTLE